MASQADVNTILAAIANGTQQVRFADGRMVTYRSMSDLNQALGILQQQIAADAPIDQPRTTLLDVTRDL